MTPCRARSSAAHPAGIGLATVGDAWSERGLWRHTFAWCSSMGCSMANPRWMINLLIRLVVCNVWVRVEE